MDRANDWPMRRAKKRAHPQMMQIITEKKRESGLRFPSATIGEICG
jgi:hypothetical protein